MKSTSTCREVSWTRTSWRRFLTCRCFSQWCWRPQPSWARPGRPKSSRTSIHLYSTTCLRTPPKSTRYSRRSAPPRRLYWNTCQRVSDITRKNGRAAIDIITGGTSLRKRYRMRWIDSSSKMRRSHSFSCSSGSRINQRRVHSTSHYSPKRRPVSSLRLLHRNKFLQCATSST